MTNNLPLAFYIDLNGPKINFDLNRKKQNLIQSDSKIHQTKMVFNKTHVKLKKGNF